MKTKLRMIADAVLAHTPPRILDIGYAQDPNPDLKERGATVFGVDIVSMPAPYDKTFVCDLNTDKLPFEDGSLQAVAMGCTLAHVATPLKVMADINRVLSKDGILVLSSPNPNYYWENVLNIFYHYFKKRVAKSKHEEHFYDFSRYNIRTIAGRTGFEVITEAGYGFFIVKTPFRFNPIRYPGLGYEIVYTLRKVGDVKSYATFEGEKGVERIDTKLFV